MAKLSDHSLLISPKLADYGTVCYRDEINRDAVAMKLNMYAYLFFKDTVLFSCHRQMCEESERVKEMLNGGRPFHPSFITLLGLHRNSGLEDFKIATMFEWHLMARLLHKGFMVHLIKDKKKENEQIKKLSEWQEKNPVTREELFKLTDFRDCDEKERNILPYVLHQTLNFENTLMKPAYKAELGLPDDLIEFINCYRQARNSIHFPGSIVDVMVQEFIHTYTKGDILKTLVDFVNFEIVDMNKRILSQYPEKKFSVDFDLRPLEVATWK